MKKNYFNFVNDEYDRLKSNQNADRLQSNNHALAADSKARTATQPTKSTHYDLGNGNYYDPHSGAKYNLNEVNKFYDEAMGKNNNKWGNYGTAGASGNVYGDDFKFKDGADAYAKKYWQNGKDINDEYERYKREAESSYNNVVNNASRQTQQAGIQKMFAMKNAQDTNNILGRGGQGAGESSARIMNTNYDNKLGNISRAVNTDIDSLSKSYIDAYNKMITNSQRNEESARGAYSDVLHDDLNTYLYGKSNSLEDAHSAGFLSNQGYTDLAGNAKTAFSYLKEDSEKELLNYINAVYASNDYFMNDYASQKLKDKYIGDVASEGSAKQVYKDYQTDINARAQQEAQRVEQAKPESYAARGAATNVADKIQSKSLYGGKKEEFSVDYDGKTWKISSNAYNDALKRNKNVNIEGKVQGDIIIDEKKGKFNYYILNNGQWNVLM